MRRRHFMQSAATAATLAGGLGWSGRLLAATPGTPRFLLVFLRGGYDANSLLVPSADGFYREVRPNIGIPPASPGVAGTQTLDADWRLHPALQDSVLPLVARRQACFVPFAGTDDLTRSHFETQDTIELGQGPGGANSHRDFGSGFLNRLAAVLPGPEPGRDAIAFTDQLPLAMRGTLSLANLSLKSDPRVADEHLRAAITGMYRGRPLAPRIEEAYAVRDEAARDLSETPAGHGVGEMRSANRNAINAKGFELEARRIGRLMRESYSLGFVDVGGWDTHVGQGAGTGYLASRLEELGRGLAAYADELGEAAWRNTVVVVLSEFGRTLRENGNRGTDHGHASVHWVLGGSLAVKSPVVGEQQAIEARTLFQDRDMPVLNEYRAVLGGLLARQFALAPAQIQHVFPGARSRDLGLL